MLGRSVPIHRQGQKKGCPKVGETKWTDYIVAVPRVALAVARNEEEVLVQELTVHRVSHLPRLHCKTSGLCTRGTQQGEYLNKFI